MELTGKCKEEFEKWVYTEDASLREFLSVPKSMQYGVLVDYFDSVGIQIGIEFFDNSRATGFDYQILTENDRDFDDENCMDSAKVYSGNDYIGLRSGARTEAIKKADELRNKALNK